MASNPIPFSFAPTQFSVPNQAGTNPNAPIPGLGGGIAAVPPNAGPTPGVNPPVPPPINQVAPPTAPVLPPVQPLMPAQYHPGLGSRILGGLGAAFLGNQTMREIPGTMQYQRAVRAHGLAEPEPGGQRTGSTPEETRGQGGTRQRLSRILGAYGGGGNNR